MRKYYTLLFLTLFFFQTHYKAQATDFYWVNPFIPGLGTLSWNNSDNWSSTPGGPGGFGVPNSPTDNAFFDGTAASITVTFSGSVEVNNLDFSAVTSNLTLDLSNFISVNGDLTLNSNVTFEGTRGFEIAGSGVQNITFNNASVPTLQIFNSNAVLQDDAIISTNLGLVGDFNIGGNNVLIENDIQALALPSNIDIIGSGTITFIGDNNSSIPSNFEAQNISLQKTNTNATLTFEGSGTIANTDIASGIISFESISSVNLGTVTGTGNGKLSMTDANNFNFGGAFFADDLVTVEFIGSSNYTIPDGLDLPNVLISGNATKTIGDINIQGDLTIFSTVNLALSNAKTLSLRGDWDNQGSFTPNGSTVLLTGDNLQSISKNGDAEQFYNIEIDKSGGSVSLDNNTDIEISNQLTFTNGNFDIGEDNIVISPSGSIVGGSASSYIITNSTGALVFEDLPSGIYTFPIGTSNQYTPVTITFDTNPSTGFTSARVGLPGSNGLTNTSLGSDYVNLIWKVNTPSLSGNHAIELSWVSPDNEVGTISDFTQVNRLNGSTWETQNTDPFSQGSTLIAAVDITSFGEFAVFVPQTEVVLTTVGPVAGDVIQGSNGVILHETTVEVSNSSTSLSAVQLSVGGSFTNSDVDNFQLILSQDNDIATTGDNTSLASITNPGFGGLLNFTSINQTLDIGTYTLFLVADINVSANIDATIQTNTPTLSNFNFSNANVSGFVTAGEVQTVIGSPSLTTNTVSNITTSSIDIEGEVTATGGVDVIERGFIYYVFDGTDKVIGDAGVLQVSDVGTFGTDIYNNNITGLSANTQYSVIAYALNDAGTGYGNRLDFRTLATEPTAQANNLIFSGLTETQIQGSFTPSTANNYLVLRKETASITTLPEDGEVYTTGALLGDATVVSVGSATTFTDTGLDAGTTYFYTIFAYNGSNESANYFTTAPLVDNETTLAPTPTITSINPTSTDAGGGDVTVTIIGTNFNTNSIVQWDDGITVTDLATTFTSSIELEATITSDLITTPSTANIQVSNPSPGGGVSNQVIFTITTPIPVNPVATSATNVGVSSFTANWASVPFVTNYLLDVSETSDFSTFILQDEGTNNTTFDVTGLSVDVTYYYRVRAVNGTGTSSYSNVISATTTDVNAVNPPSDLTLEVLSPTEIDIYWSDNSDNEVFFDIQRSVTGLDADFVSIASPGANETFYSDTPVLSNTTYYYRIRAIGAISSSSFSTTESITTPEITPDAPSELEAIPISSAQINLIWSDNSDNETGFSIERSEGDLFNFTEVATVASDVFTYEDTGLTNETLYYYRIRAVRTSVFSDYSNVTGAVTSDIPLAANNLTLVSTGIDNVELSWQDNSANETGFVVEVFTLVEGFFSEVLTTGQNETSAVISELSPNRAYLFRVKAINEGGDSPYTNTVSTVTLIDVSVPLPNAPNELDATAVTQDEISLRWQDNSNNEEGFKIERSLTPNPGDFVEIAEVLTGVTEYNDEGLTNNTTYFYRVRASNAGGNSAYSNIASARADCNLLVLVESETGGNTFCNGKDALLIATTNTDLATYRWLRGGVPIPNANLSTYLASEEGKYTCEVISGGCREVSTPEFVLIFEENFEVNINLSPENVLQADFTGAQFYQWYYEFEPIEGANSARYTPTRPGTYFVIVTDDGCSATSSAYEFGDITTGIEDLTLSKNLNVFPNPTQSMLHLELDNTRITGDYEIYLTDTKGKSILIKQGQKTEKLLREHLDISSFPQGMYFIEFRHQGKVGQKRVMKY